MPDEAARRHAAGAKGASPDVPPSSLHGTASLPLAQGDLDAEDAAELLELKRLITGSVGFHCDGYKERCLRRRIAVRMRAHGIHKYADYGALLSRDAAEFDRLLDALTINVSKFYRNPEVWDVLRTTVVPELFALPNPEIRIWSAGCAGGEEPYTISMVLQEHAAAHGQDTDRFRILATDIDRESLAYAGRGTYTQFAMSDIDPAMRDRWFTGAGPFQLRPEARRNVEFATLDLIRDAYPQSQHVIFCRNVIIYFERAVQEQLFRRFHEALVPGGFLVLGKVEALFGQPSGLFTSVANRHRIFRRP